MNVCVCKLQNSKSFFKTKCKICRVTLCESCAKGILCGRCTLVKKTNFETEDLMLLSEENLLEIASFFQLTLLPYTLTKTEIVKIILNAYVKRPKSLRKLSKIQLQEAASVFYSSDDSLDEEEFGNSSSNGCKEDINNWIVIEKLSIEDIPNLSTKELKRHLERLNVDLKNCIEKQDFVDLLKFYLGENENQVSVSKREKKYSSSDLRNIHVSSHEIKVEDEHSKEKRKKYFSLQDINNLEEIPSMSSKQLKYILEKMSIDCQHMCEKSELAYRVSLLFQQTHIDETLGKPKVHRKVSKRDGFYVKAEGEDGTKTKSFNKLTLEDIKSSDMIESFSKDELKQILIENSTFCDDTKDSSFLKWELAFKVLQLWTAYQASKEEDLKRCIICCNADISCTILECGHTITCNVCVLKLDICPMCKGQIKRVVNIFKP